MCAKEETGMTFQDKIVVITGGALGIGQVLVREFARAGAKVAYIDLNEEAGARLAQELRESGGDVCYHPGDISDPAALERFAKEVADRYGGVDCLINNAMLTFGGILSGCSWEDFNKALQIGVSAPYYLTMLFLPHFRPGAAIVNLSSTRAFQSQANTESYTAAKGGITALTHALSVSLAGKVRVNAVAPGWIDTGATYSADYVPQYTLGDLKQHPSGRVGEPMDIVRMIMFLCDEANSFINGQTMIVDGGMSKRMIYTGDEGWLYTPKDDGSAI